jgi:hypothetical protein
LATEHDGDDRASAKSEKIDGTPPLDRCVSDSVWQTSRCGLVETRLENLGELFRAPTHASEPQVSDIRLGCKESDLGRVPLVVLP